jgi:hypothetical protein
LITTLFARLFLGDLFLHGLGGAKYDQVTEAIIERFFGVKPPGSMTLTATLRLPIARQQVTPGDARRVEHDLRELAFHGERYLETDGQAGLTSLVAEKSRWIGTTPTQANAKQRCHKIMDVNDRLHPYLARSREVLLAERKRIAEALRTEGILASREYAFCLYPADSLRRLMELAPA